MGRLSDWLLGPQPSVTAAAAVALAPTRSLHGPLPWGVGPPLEPFTTPDAPPFFDRDACMTVPAIARARDLLVTAVSQLPLTAWAVDWNSAPIVQRQIPGPNWIQRPDPDRTRQHLLAWTCDDLIFYAVSYWMVTSRYSNSFPAAFRRIPPGDLQENGGTWTFTAPNGQRRTIDPADIVQFLSPLDGLLTKGYRAISIALQLDAAADRFASAEVPAGVLEEQEGSEDLTTEELTELALHFTMARQTNTIAALNKYLRYQPIPNDPSKMQLVEAREYQALEMARLMNTPAYLVSAPAGTGMTYLNAETARADLITFGAQAFISTIEQTLSGDNVTPRGQALRLDLNAWLRSPWTEGEPSPNDAQITDPTTPAMEMEQMEQSP